jgi:hypothetical protein
MLADLLSNENENSARVGSTRDGQSVTGKGATPILYHLYAVKGEAREAMQHVETRDNELERVYCVPF